MELLMWVAVAFPLLIIINGALLAKLDNQRKIINLENILHGFDEKDYHGFKEFRANCRHGQDCHGSLPQAYVCRGKYCECADGYKPNASNTTCVGAIGMLCMYDSHCIANAYCKGQMFCACKLEYPLESDDKWFCDEDSNSSSKRSVVFTSCVAYQLFTGTLFTYVYFMNF